MTQQNSFNQCNVCGRQLVLKSNVKKPDGTFYPPFRGCEVWDDEHKKARDAYKSAKNGYKPSPDAFKSPTANEEDKVWELLIIERIDAVNARLDKLIEYVVSKLK